MLPGHLLEIWDDAASERHSHLLHVSRQMPKKASETHTFLALFFPLFIPTFRGFLKKSFSVFFSPLGFDLISPILMMGDTLLLPSPMEPWACEGLQEGRESWRDTAHSGMVHPEFLL